MTFERILKPNPELGHTRFVTVSKGVRGWFAVEYWWNTTDNAEPFWEPWESHCCSFDEEDQAQSMAEAWAQAEDLPLLVKAEVQP